MWGVVIFLLSVMCVVEGVLLWAVCVCVSSCRCCVVVSVVHTVAILSAVFCVICSLLDVCVDASGGHIVETLGLVVMDLYVAIIVSLCFPHVVDVSALSICIFVRAFVVVLSIFFLYVSLGSRVSLSMAGLMFMGSVVLFICNVSMLFCLDCE